MLSLFVLDNGGCHGGGGHDDDAVVSFDEVGD